MAVVIAAPSSGTGKTLFSLALLAWARSRGHTIQPFKIGPDYLDPQLLSAAAQRSCRNLDSNLCGEAWVKQAFQGYGGGADLALVEGVMGLFDGIGSTETGSTAATARLLDLPVVLVVDAGGQAASVAALVRGFRDHDPHLRFAGVVLNRVSSARHRELLAEVLSTIQVPLLGCLPKTPDLALPSRHLGLAPAHELDQPRQREERWAALAEAHLELDQLLPLLSAPPSGSDPLGEPSELRLEPLPVAIATDDAFHFRYSETGELLERMGMPLMAWSPLADEPLPVEARGVMLPGGFPEQHAEQLSHCQRSLESLRLFSRTHPIYAECGGMLLLGDTLTDLNGQSHPMAGILPFQAERGRLQVGYRRLQPLRNGLITQAGEGLRGHEFHRWELKQGPGAEALWDIDGWRKTPQPEGWGHRTLHASWVHLHWASSSTICSRWRAALATAPKPSSDASSAVAKSGFNRFWSAGN